MATLVRVAPTREEVSAEEMYDRFSYFLEHEWICPVNGNTYKAEQSDLLLIRQGKVTKGEWADKEVYAMPCPCGGFHVRINAFHWTHDHGWEPGYSHIRKSHVKFYKQSA